MTVPVSREHSDSGAPHSPRSRRWTWAVPAIVITGIAIVLMAWAQTVTLPQFCPAIHPAPLYCDPSSRAIAGAVGSSTLVLLLAGTFVANAQVSPPNRVRVILALLVALAFIAFVVVRVTLVAAAVVR